MRAEALAGRLPGIEFVRADRRRADAYLEMAREFRAHGQPPLFEEVLADPEAFFDRVARFEAGVDLPEDRVQQTEFWLVREGRILGGSRLRHRLIPALESDGGNIGYEVRPSERRRGYASWLLQRTLVEARRIGLARVLLTAEPGNRASIRVIEKNGGLLQDSARSPRHGREMLRFWIEL